MRVELFLAQRYLFRGKRRHFSLVSIMAVTGIALGVATLVIVTSVMNGFDHDLTSRLLSFNYHLVVESRSNFHLDVIREKIKKIPQVKNASLFLHTQIFAKFDDYFVPLLVKGIDFRDKEERATFYRFVEREVAKQGFFVGEGLTQKFFLREKIEFYPLERKLILKEKRIRGVFKVGLYDLDNNYLVCDLEEAKSLSKNYLLYVGVKIKNPWVVDEVKKEIEKRIDEPLIINTWIDANRVLFSALKLEKITMFVILSLIIVVAAFTILSILMVKVAEKVKDIGILKAIGFDSGKILGVFISQGVILGILGLLGGLSIGGGLCFLLKEYHIIKIPEEIYYINYLPVYIDYRDILAISFICVLLSFIASLIPAFKASKLSVSEALRYE
ncbi:MAG: hypothetical protein DRP68_04075 [Candidatus Omnitrophota bacterium]|mgnify:CR=1 FL=1|nr:MAG: hypothetical protein DRP68_04075 [Candidatus Omnitrophota bacterium]RKY46045.1 MAG: hypothetical protein DRP81_01785 [Candidatus Omnitrophota bacterium]HDN86479.1 ABC transporter permease [Candidatus Omnitrophota bacterium]